jgi:hypothetical protein
MRKVEHTEKRKFILEASTKRGLGVALNELAEKFGIYCMENDTKDQVIVFKKVRYPKDRVLATYEIGGLVL